MTSASKVIATLGLCAAVALFLCFRAQSEQPRLGGVVGAAAGCRAAAELCRAVLSTVPVSQPLSNPGPAVVHPVLRDLRWTGGPEVFFRQLLDALPSDAVRTIVDVGANRGGFALAAAKRGHRAIAFEPMPSNIDAFEKLLSRQGHSERVTLIKKGVGDKPTTVAMRGNSGGASAVSAKDKISYDVGAQVELQGCNRAKYVCQDVHITTLDTEPAIAAAEHIFVMKLDIQGIETNAFRGGAHLLARRAVDVFIIEFDPALQAEQNGSCEEIMLLLRGAGYVLFSGAIITKGHGYKPSWDALPLGVSLTFDQYADLLKSKEVYTDLVAVRYDLVPRALIDGRLGKFASTHRKGGLGTARAGKGRGKSKKGWP